MIEFDCCECRQHVVAIVAEKAPEPPLCALCVSLPGWHEDPKLRRLFMREEATS